MMTPKGSDENKRKDKVVIYRNKKDQFGENVESGVQFHTLILRHLLEIQLEILGWK